MTSIFHVERKIKEYERNIKRLKHLEKELNSLVTKGFENEILSIKSKLKNPSKVKELEKEIDALKRKIKKKETHSGRIIKIKSLKEYKTKHAVTSVKYSPDGSKILLGSDDLYLANTDGKVIWEKKLEPPKKPYVLPVAFFPDGKRMAAGKWKNLYIMNMKGDLLFSKELHYNIHAISFSPDGSKIAVGLGKTKPHPEGLLPVVGEPTNGELYLLDFITGEESYYKEPQIPVISVDPKGDRIAVGCAINIEMLFYGMIYLYGEKGLLWSEKIKQLVTSVSFSPEGNKIAVGTTCSATLGSQPLGKSGVYVLSTKGELLWMNNDLYPILNLRYSPFGDKIVAGSTTSIYVLSEDCRILDMQRIFPDNPFFQHSINDAIFSPGGSEIAIGYKKGIKIFEIQVEEVLKGLRFSWNKKIGSGGFAEVYLARTSNNELVAIKIQKVQQFETVSTSGFLKEISIWKNLNHPNIVGLYDYNDKPIPWLSMEYMDGGSLRERLNQLSFAESKKIIIKVAKALEYAHNKAAIHRDIKPENILFKFKANEPKLADWGLARDLTTFSTLSAGFRGTCEYAAPEQFSNKFGNIDYQTDIYQSGVVLYEMVTGLLPYKSDNIESFIKNVTSEDNIPPVRKINPNISKKLEDIIMECLAKNKRGRYQSISELIKDLDEVI
jgi:WD40 repeat protein